MSLIKADKDKILYRAKTAQVWALTRLEIYLRSRERYNTAVDCLTEYLYKGIFTSWGKARKKAEHFVNNNSFRSADKDSIDRFTQITTKLNKLISALETSQEKEFYLSIEDLSDLEQLEKQMEGPLASACL